MSFLGLEKRQEIPPHNKGGGHNRGNYYHRKVCPGENAEPSNYWQEISTVVDNKPGKPDYETNNTQEYLL